ncbi:MAG: CopD family protein [Luteibacter sp.]
MAYLLIKSLHIVFVIAWMATVFYLPRILINLVEAGGEPAVCARLELMGRRLYKFGHSMFGMALVFGLVLWLYFHSSGGWLHAKLALVAVMLAYFIWSGRLLKRSMAGGTLPPSRTLRIFNELPVLVLLAIVFLVVGKPF